MDHFPRKSHRDKDKKEDTTEKRKEQRKKESIVVNDIKD